MVKTCIKRVVNVPIERAWEIVSDFSHVHHIHPLVKTVDQKSSNSTGLGAVRQCNLYDGHKAVEKIVEYDEENKVYKIELIDTDMPMKSVIATMSATPVDGGKKTLLACHMAVKAKFGLLGKMMEYMVMKPQLGGAIGDLFDGVEYYNKTGKDIQKGYKAKTPAMISPVC